MTNVFGTPEKIHMRDRLFEIAQNALVERGWSVERVPGAGKASLRRLRKDGEAKLATIRTSQDTSIAFPRNRANSGWLTLDEADVVVAASVDDRLNPKFALVHMIDADEMRARFDRAYKMRLKAGHRIPVGRGVWVRLYEEDDDTPARAGAGAGLHNSPIAKVPLQGDEIVRVVERDATVHVVEDAELPPLTIPEAKIRLARSLGVDPSAITIVVEA